MYLTHCVCRRKVELLQSDVANLMVIFTPLQRDAPSFCTIYLHQQIELLAPCNHTFQPSYILCKHTRAPRGNWFSVICLHNCISSVCGHWRWYCYAQHCKEAGVCVPFIDNFFTKLNEHTINCCTPWYVCCLRRQAACTPVIHKHVISCSLK